MVFFRDVRLVRLLLIITAAVRISNLATSRDEPKRSTWIQYIDAMYAVCISQEDAEVSMKLTTLLHCFNAQWKHFQCIISSKPSDDFLAATSTISFLQTPCGLIHLSNKEGAPFRTRQWTITVHSQLYLNLTFQELVLPMPYGRCDLHLGSEYLLIRDVFDSLDLTVKDRLFLCGEHSPFSMVWRDSRALLVYRRVPSITQIGHFRIRYQVCDHRVRTRKVNIIYHASVLQRAKSTWLKVSELPFSETGPEHVTYTIHLLGSKLKLLDMMFVLADARQEYFSIEAFDGPGQDELHRHPIEHQVLEAKWIYFSTFQGYLQITCEKYHCGGIFVKYRWPSSLPFAYDIMLAEDLIINLNDVAGLCSQDNYWYCIFSIGTRIRDNVEISLHTVNFHGPDYLGGFSEPYNCLLAGITIADEYRTTFMSSEDSEFKDLGDISRDLAVDSVLPEITTCYDVPLAVGDSVVWGFPIDTFVSYGPRLILVIYAYGAYIDMSTSDIKMVARPSHSAGLIVSCPTIPADGYLGIGTQDISGNVATSQMKRLTCPLQDILYVKLASKLQERENALSSEVIICTYSKLKMTAVTIVPHLIEQFGSGVVRSLFVQRNPYAYEEESQYGCNIQAMDLRLAKHLHYNLSIKVPVAMVAVPFSVVATSLTSGTLTFSDRNQVTGQYSKVRLSTLSKYILNMELNVTLPCAEAVRHQLNGKDDNIFYHLQEAADAPQCQSYVISLRNNDNTTTDNNTHLMYFPKVPFLTVLDTVIDGGAKMGKLTAVNFNWNMGGFLFIINIHLTGKCAQHCKHVKIQIVYRALVSHNIVSLQWNLVLNSSGFQVTLSDIPVSGLLLYITSLSDKCLQKECSANIDVQYDNKQDHVLPIWNGRASNHTPFAEYHLLWIYREYTWDEAEEICQELDGMHLASISSEKEYLLITRMLFGGVYHEFDTDKFHLPLLTPCLMGSPLCLIYIGLKRQVS